MSKLHENARIALTKNDNQYKAKNLNSTSLCIFFIIEIRYDVIILLWYGANFEDLRTSELSFHSIVSLCLNWYHIQTAKKAALKVSSKVVIIPFDKVFKGPVFLL